MEKLDRSEAWPDAEIRKAFKEADAGDFATDEEVAALDAKWSLEVGQGARKSADESTWPR